MKIDPITISLIALAVSILSFLLSLFRARVDRRLQWEQMRGSVHARLTSRCIEILSLVDELQFSNKKEATEIIMKFIRILAG